MHNIPTLETDRLILTAPSQAAIAPFHAFYASARATYVGGGISDFKMFQAWAAISNMIGHWSLRGYGLWTLHRRSDAAVLGHCGLLHWHDWPEAELAYCLYDETFEHHGYITEAATTALTYAANHLGQDRVASFVDPQNTASINVATRLGAAPQSTITLRDEPATLYRHQSWKGAADA